MALANPCPESPIPWRERGEGGREGGKERKRVRGREGAEREMIINTCTQADT